MIGAPGSLVVLAGLILAVAPLGVLLDRRNSGSTGATAVLPADTFTFSLKEVRHLGTLFGICFLSHRIGSFLGAWMPKLRSANACGASSIAYDVSTATIIAAPGKNAQGISGKVACPDSAVRQCHACFSGLFR